MGLKGKRVAILAENNYQEMELWYPYYRMKEAGAEVVVVAPQARTTYTSKLGYPVTSDLASADARAQDFDAVIVPGGYAPDNMRKDANLVRLVREADQQGKIVGTICHAGWMLCSANIVRGRQATCVANIKDDLINAGANYVDCEVVRDRNLITSRLPGDLPAFCRELIGALEGARELVGAAAN